MDFQKYVDGFGAMTCIVSVENLGNGKRGKFRIVTGNKAYIDSIEHPAPGAELLTQKFTPNQEYTNYLTRDLNFEEYCYKAAVEKRCLNSYATADRIQGVWFNMVFLPVAYEEGNLCFCTYTMEINFEANLDRMSSLPADVTANVIKICLELRSAKEFNEMMDDVIYDIQNMFGDNDPDRIYQKEIDFYCKNMICTDGGKKVRLISPQATKDYEVKAVKTVSTIGAGDNFNAGIIYGLITEKITKETVNTMTEEQWDRIIKCAIDFASHVCQSLNNSISREFAENYLGKKMQPRLFD